MSNYDNVNYLFEEYANRWNNSDMSRRITSVESTAVLSGRVAPWEGGTITQFWLDAMRELIDTVRENPELLRTPQSKLQEFIDSERELIEEADELTAQINGYAFGILDPRYHRDTKELHRVVSEFKLVADDYQVKWDELPKG